MRALLLAFLLALPLAAAQATNPTQPTLVVSLDDPGRSLPPGGEGVIGLTINYIVPASGVPTPEPTDLENGSRPTFVTLSLKKAPSWTTGGWFDPPVVRIQVPPGGGARQARAELHLNVSPEAPAGQREDLVVAATAEANGNLQSASGESPPLKIRPSFVYALNVTPVDEGPVIIGGGRWTPVAFTVRNLGNSEVTAKLNVTLAPENSQVRFPDSLTLPVKGEQVVEVEVRTPWTYAEFGTLELEALPLTEDDEPPAAAGSVDVSGQSAVPGPPLPLLAGILVACVLLRRRAST